MKEEPSVAASVDAPAKKTKSYKWQALKFCLTASCPVGLKEHPWVGHEGEVKELLEEQFGLPLKQFVLSEEDHEKDNTHFHVWVKFAKRVRKSFCCRVLGVVVNDQKRKDGKKTSQVSWLKYITKDGPPKIEYGVDVETLIRVVGEKQCTKTAQVIYMLKTGKTVAEIDAELPEMVFRNNKRIVEYERFLQDAAYRPRTPLPVKPKCWMTPQERAICEWWNIRCVAGDWVKAIAGLYLWSHEKDRQKTTLLKVMSTVMNFDTSTWLWADKGWQGWARDNMRLLPIDGLQNTDLSFSFVESLGSNNTVTIPKRGRQGVRFRGAFGITSNKHWLELGYSQDMEIWRVRLLTLEVTRPLARFAEYFAEVHGLDYSQFHVKVKIVRKRKLEAMKALDEFC